MKALFRTALGVGLLSMAAVTAGAQSTDLEKTFANPKSVQTSCYWYWLSGNDSKEGVINDIKTMKQQGINRAFIGIQGLGTNEVPTGSVRFKSPEWWDIMHAALKTASEEGVEIGIFNGPGWSHMGGSWVKPEESMRYLASQRKVVKGGKTVTVDFGHPSNFLSNVRVLAYKNKLATVVAGPANATVTGSGIDGVNNVIDGDTATAATIKGNSASIEVSLKDKNFVLRSLQLYAKTALSCNVSVKVDDGTGYKEVKKFNVNRTNMEKNTGYDVFAPIAEAIADAKASKVKIDFTSVNAGAKLGQVVISSEPVVSRFAEKILARMHQTPQPFWHDYKWAIENNYKNEEMVAENEVLDLTSSLNGDVLTWKAPKGEWTIVRTYMAPTGIKCSPALDEDGRGLEVDRWSKTALRNHYNAYMGEIERKIPAADRSTWKVVVCDSYETATQNFGDDFFEYFKSHFGYDPTPYLLCYSGTVVGSTERSDRFLWDLRRMIADRLAYDNIGEMNKIAGENGKHTWLESYGHWGFPGEFLQYGSRSGEVAGEFWSEGTLGDIENRAASSVAHIYGKGLCSAESFTAGGPEFSRSPRNFKERGDKFFTEGINNTLLHVYVQQRNEDVIPDVIPWFGNEFNRKNTWYDQLHFFTDYCKRANLLLQQGTYVADVAYFIGEDAPVMTGLVEPALPAGFQYDFINADVIENTLAANGNHELTLPYGNKYKILVLPPSKTIRPACLKAIKKLIEDGAIVLGPKPEKSPSLQNYPQCDDEVKALADEMWGATPSAKQVRAIGKGFLYTGYSLEELNQLYNIKPDCEISGTAEAVRYCHYTKPGQDIYFVANQSGKDITINAKMRVSGMKPELWNAVDGSKRDAQSYLIADGTTTVPLQLAPLESVFIVYRTATADAGNAQLDAAKNFKQYAVAATPAKTWKVDFATNYGFAKSITMDELKDWTTFDNDPDIKYIGGKGTYTSTFKLGKLPAGKSVALRLGMVNNNCAVKVNGQEVGGLWTPPYVLDITSAVKKGNNTIEITVENNLCNRMIGDQVDPANKKLHASHVTWTKDSKLQPSGLVGPVEILVEK